MIAEGRKPGPNRCSAAAPDQSLGSEQLRIDQSPVLVPRSRLPGEHDVNDREPAICQVGRYFQRAIIPRRIARGIVGASGCIKVYLVRGHRANLPRLPCSLRRYLRESIAPIRVSDFCQTAINAACSANNVILARSEAAAALCRRADKDGPRVARFQHELIAKLGDLQRRPVP
jgi:hypothetical protein